MKHDKGYKRIEMIKIKGHNKGICIDGDATIKDIKFEFGKGITNIDEIKEGISQSKKHINNGMESKHT